MVAKEIVKKYLVCSTIRLDNSIHELFTRERSDSLNAAIANSLTLLTTYVRDSRQDEIDSRRRCEDRVKLLETRTDRMAQLPTQRSSQGVSRSATI